MTFAATMIFYHLIGFGVATAVFLSDSRQGRLLPAFRLATAVVFWPLYLPIVLSGTRSGTHTEAARSQVDRDTMFQAISRVEAELETALASLDGWVEDVLAHEAGRFHELSTAWRARQNAFAKWTACSRKPSRRTARRRLTSPAKVPTIDTVIASRLAARISHACARSETRPSRT